MGGFERGVDIVQAARLPAAQPAELLPPALPPLIPHIVTILCCPHATCRCWRRWACSTSRRTFPPFQPTHPVPHHPIHPHPVHKPTPQVLEAVGLQHVPLHVPPWALSGGQQRRLALAIQLVRGPALLLLDEPLAGLDWVARQEVVAILKKLKVSFH